MTNIRLNGLKSANNEVSRNISMRYSKLGFMGGIAVLLLILRSGSWIANLGADWLQIAVVIITIGINISVFPWRNVNNNVLRAVIFAVFVILFIVIIRPGSMQISDVNFVLNMSLAAMTGLIFNFQRDLPFLMFVRLMYFLCISSLLVYPLVFLMPELIVSVPDLFQKYFEGTYRENRKFYTLFGVSFFASAKGTEGIWRNQSIFWEPGMLGVFCSLAIVISDIYRRNVKERLVFMLTIITTFAPGAYVLLLVYLSIKFTVGVRVNINKLLIVLSAYSVIFFYFITSAFFLLKLIFNREFGVDSSILIRSTDLWLPYFVALESPFVGHATTIEYSNAMNVAIERSMEGITNSLGAFVYRYGYLSFTIFILFFF